MVRESRPQNWNRHARRAAESKTLRALTGSAVALLGAAGKASADGPVERPRAQYRYSTYAEDDLGQSKAVPDSDLGRYEVETHQLFFQSPLPYTEHWDFGVQLMHETMSGASPWYVVNDAAGIPVQVMSGASTEGVSIDDTRNDLLGSLNYYYDDGRLGFTSGYSTEDDYSAFNLGLNGDLQFNEKNTTVSWGLGGSLDTIEPVDTELYPTRPDNEDKKSVNLNLGLSQIWTRKSIVQANFGYRYNSGYLSDPYKEYFQVGVGLNQPDQRPDSRHQFSLSGRWRHHVEELNGSLHFGYQFYYDTWDVMSHTIDVSWYQNWNDAFGFDTIRLVPMLRYYSQSEADFYKPFSFAGEPVREYSNDYRLSAYGAVSLGIRLETSFRLRWTGDTLYGAHVSYEKYTSSSDLAFGDVDLEAPGLVSFKVMSAGLSVRF